MQNSATFPWQVFEGLEELESDGLGVKYGACHEEEKHKIFLHVIVL